MYQPLSQIEEQLAKEVVDIAIKVHKELGPGLLESIYQKCFCHELERRGIPYKQQVAVPIYFESLKIDDGLRLDLLVDNLIVLN